MLGDLKNNPELLVKYDKDKEQLKYEQDVLEVFKHRHRYIKFIHPAILLKNRDFIMKEIGISPKYLKYIPSSIINKYQQEILEYAKTNIQVFPYINRETQLNNKLLIIDMIRNNPLYYDYLDVSLKKDNKELFIYCLEQLYNVGKEYIIDIYYKCSLDNNRLLHNMKEVLLDEELINIIEPSIEKVIKSVIIVDKLELIYNDKSKYSIFKSLLALYNNRGNIENYFNRILELMNREYYLYEGNKNIVKLSTDLYTYLSQKELSTLEEKRLYYLLHTDFIHINNIKDFSKVNKLRMDLLKQLPLDSIRDYKKVLFEYKYCMSYMEVVNILDKYSNYLSKYLSKYKKFKYQLDEIEEYEALLTLKEMNTIHKCNDIKELDNYLKDTLLTNKESKSLDNLIYLEDILRSIANKDILKKINKKIIYLKEETCIYEELVSKTKQLKEYVGYKINIKYIDPHTDISMFVTSIEENYLDNYLVNWKDREYLNKYDYITNSYIPLNSKSIYVRYNNFNKYELFNIDNEYYLNDYNNPYSIICIDKLNIKAVKASIDFNIPIEILPLKGILTLENKRIESLYNKIMHYINPEYNILIDYYKSYTPLNCLPILINNCNSLYLAKHIDKNILTNMLDNILKEVENSDNEELRKQCLNIMFNTLVNNNIIAYDKKTILRYIDKLYRKFRLYKRDNRLYEEYYLSLEKPNIDNNKKYNKNQLEYNKIRDKININKIKKNVKVLKEHSSYQDIPTMIRLNIMTYILTYQVYPSILNIALYAITFHRLGYIPSIDKIGDYSASLFRAIYKNRFDKDDINIICAVLDYQDSQEDIEKIKNKYKIKDIDKFEELTYIIHDILLLDKYTSKKEFHYVRSLRLFKINECVKDLFIEVDIDKYITNNVISYTEYEKLLTDYTKKEILDICKK